MWQTRVAAFAVAVLGLGPATGAAAPFSRLIVMGDSLSDSGNVFTTSFNAGKPVPALGGPGFPPPPYAQRFSNGMVAVEYLAQLLGLPLVNFAYGGATTGSAFGDPDGGGPQVAQPNFLNASRPFLDLPPFPNMLDQLAAHLAATGGAADPQALYVVWGGPNDIFLGQLTGQLFVPGGAQAILGYAVTNLVTITGQLLARGATGVLVPGMPDLGLTPAFDGNEALGTLLTQQFNAALLAALMANLPLGWTYFDTSAALHALVANPAAYGFTNVTDACVVQSPPFYCGALGDPNQYLFWDSAHPTTAAHAALAQEVAAAAVPEPGTLLLVGGGVVAAVAARRRTRSVRARR